MGRSIKVDDIISMTIYGMRGEVWESTRQKNGNYVPVYLHPIAVDIIKSEWAWGMKIICLINLGRYFAIAATSHGYLTLAPALLPR